MGINYAPNVMDVYNRARYIMSTPSYSTVIIRTRVALRVSAALNAGIIAPGSDWDTEVAAERDAIGNTATLISAVANRGLTRELPVRDYARQSETMLSVYVCHKLTESVTKVISVHNNSACPPGCLVCANVSYAATVLHAGQHLLLDVDRRDVAGPNRELAEHVRHSTRELLDNDGTCVLISCECVTCGTVARVPFGALALARVACTNHFIGPTFAPELDVQVG